MESRSPKPLFDQADTPVGEVQLGMLAKLWRPGLVKTRLGTQIGMQSAAYIHKLFVEYLSETFSAISAENLERTFLNAIVTPKDSKTLSAFRSVLPDSWSTLFQSEGDLGCRIQNWMQSALDGAPNTSAIMIGADCPLLNEPNFRQSIHELRSHDLVLGPALDGGYYLIGLQGPWRMEYAALFDDIPWSTDRVLAMTLERASRNDISVATLPPQEDIDTFETLMRLRKQLAVSQRPREKKLLAQVDRVLCQSLN